MLEFFIAIVLQGSAHTLTIPGSQFFEKGSSSGIVDVYQCSNVEIKEEGSH